MADPEADAIRMAAVGDSITDGDSRDFAGGVPGPQSWVSYAAGPEVDFVGGWAEWGASAEAMAQGVTGPFDADVLVILAGTNDAAWTPHEEVGRHLVDIAETAEIDEVVLSSIPPNAFSLGGAAELNSSLEDLAHQQDWVWVDSAADLRDGDGYADEMSYDGIHPTEAGARVIGEAIGEAVRESAASRNAD